MNTGYSGGDTQLIKSSPLSSKLEETEDSEQDKCYESSEEDKNKKLTIESAIEKKYLNSLALNKKKFYEEIKE